MNEKIFNEGNQIHNVKSSSGSGTVINYGSVSDFLTSYGSDSGSSSTSQKVTVPTVLVPVPQHCLNLLHTAVIVIAAVVVFEHDDGGDSRAPGCCCYAPGCCACRAPGCCVCRAPSCCGCACGAPRCCCCAPRCYAYRAPGCISSLPTVTCRLKLRKFVI